MGNPGLDLLTSHSWCSLRSSRGCRVGCEPRTHQDSESGSCDTVVAGSEPELGLSRPSVAKWSKAIISLLQGRRRWWWGRHSLSITVIVGSFYEHVMGPESGQPSVLLSQFGDLLMGERAVLGARSFTRDWTTCCFVVAVAPSVPGYSR